VEPELELELEQVYQTFGYGSGSRLWLHIKLKK
jgi:hypothetical protein